MREQDQPGENLPAIREGLDINKVSRGIIPKPPSHYLAQYGFTERLPVLLAELNSALSTHNPDPVGVRMVLHPNLESPQVVWQPTFTPRPQIGIEFSIGNRKNKGKLSAGKEIVNEGAFFYSDDRTGVEPKPGDHESPDYVVSVDLKGLKDFVKKVFPKKRGILYGDRVVGYTKERIERLKSVVGVRDPSLNDEREVLEDLTLLNPTILAGLPLGGYSIRLVPREFKVGTRDKDLKQYPRMEDVPDNLLEKWYRTLFGFRNLWGLYDLPYPFETFLYVSLEEADSFTTSVTGFIGRHFQIRRLEYTGTAKSIERVLGLLNQLFQAETSRTIQRRVDVAE